MRTKADIVDDVYGAVEAILGTDVTTAGAESFVRMIADDRRIVIDVLVDLIKRAANNDPDHDIAATQLLPDPVEASALLRAAIDEDAEELAAFAPGGYAELLAKLVALAAAIVSSG